MLPLHHIHKRKNKSKKTNPLIVRVIDGCVYFAATLGPVFTLPQLYLVWTTKDVTGISLATWEGYLVISIVWLVYGIYHKVKPIIFCNVLWTLVDGGVVLGILMYR